MPMYNLTEYSSNYAKTSGSLWQYYKDGLNDNIADSESFKFKARITGRTLAAGNKDFKKRIKILTFGELLKSL